MVANWSLDTPNVSRAKQLGNAFINFICAQEEPGWVNTSAPWYIKNANAMWLLGQKWKLFQDQFDAQRELDVTFARQSSPEQYRSPWRAGGVRSAAEDPEGLYNAQIQRGKQDSREMDVAELVVSLQPQITCKLPRW